MSKISFDNTYLPKTAKLLGASSTGGFSTKSEICINLPSLDTGFTTPYLETSFLATSCTPTTEEDVLS